MCISDCFLLLLTEGEKMPFTLKYKRLIIIFPDHRSVMNLMPSVSYPQFYPWTSALQGPHPNCQAGHVYIFFRCVPSWVLCHFYPEKWIWVVVLRFREITDLWAPNHGRRPAAPQAIERLQTTGLSSKYIQWTGALPLEGNQWGKECYDNLLNRADDIWII